jgi:hypothetical protein
MFYSKGGQCLFYDPIDVGKVCCKILFRYKVFENHNFVVGYMINQIIL